jgi:hypothetical protein
LSKEEMRSAHNISPPLAVMISIQTNLWIELSKSRQSRNIRTRRFVADYSMTSVYSTVSWRLTACYVYRYVDCTVVLNGTLAFIVPVEVRSPIGFTFSVKLLTGGGK